MTGPSPLPGALPPAQLSAEKTGEERCCCSLCVCPGTRRSPRDTRLTHLLRRGSRRPRLPAVRPPVQRGDSSFHPSVVLAASKSQLIGRRTPSRWELLGMLRYFQRRNTFGPRSRTGRTVLLRQRAAAKQLTQ